jgi:hypothetical protein
LKIACPSGLHLSGFDLNVFEVSCAVYLFLYEILKLLAKPPYKV